MNKGFKWKRLWVKIPRKMVKYVAIVLNSICVLGMVACAYSIYFDPQTHPRLSYWGLAFPLFLIPTFLFGILWLCLRRWWGLISGIGLMVCCVAIRTYFPLNFPSGPPDGAIKVMSYNIYQLGKNVDGKSWSEAGIPKEESPIVNYLVASDADIVCCQEAFPLKEAKVDSVLATAYPYREYVKVHTETVACLSRFPIVGSDSIDYPSVGNGSVAFKVLVKGDTVLVINNHFESYKLNDADKAEYKELVVHPDDENARQNFEDLSTKVAAANAIRAKQADIVDELIAKSPYRYIIACGDFNDASLSYVHWRMTRHLNDAFTRSGNGPGITYHRSGMYFRIDNILYSPAMTPYRCYVDSDIHTSDHYPIICWLTLDKD